MITLYAVGTEAHLPAHFTLLEPIERPFSAADKAPVPSPAQAACDHPTGQAVWRLSLAHVRNSPV